MNHNQKHPDKESFEPGCYTSEFYQAFNEELTTVLLKLKKKKKKKTEEGETLLNLFYEASIVLLPKTDKYITGKDNYR